MRIVFVFPVLWEKGGVATAVRNWATHLSRRGHEVYLSAWHLEKDGYEFASSNPSSKSGRIIRWATKLAARRWQHTTPKLGGFPLSSVVLLPLVFRAVKKINPDVIFINTAHSLIGIPAALNPDKLFVCYYHSPPKVQDGRISGGLLRLCTKLTATWTLTITNSNYTANRLGLELGIRDSEVVYPGVDGPIDYSPNGPSDGKSLLSLARFTPKKRQGFLIRLLPELLQEREVYLTLAGALQRQDLSYVSHLRGLVSSLGVERHVSFCFDVPYSRIAQLYSEASIFVHPQVEDFGLTILEAMSAGTPVIANREGGAAEIIEDGKSGFLIPYDPNRWVRQISDLLDRPDLMSTISSHARNRASEFSSEKSGRALEGKILRGLETGGLGQR